MTKIQADMCDCCKEIWNKNNLKNIKVGEHILHFCSDCFTEYIKPLDKIRAEIEQAKLCKVKTNDGKEIIANVDFVVYPDKRNYTSGLDTALQIIDKYIKEE